MPDSKRFISDENIPIKITELLREKGFDVKIALLGSSDKEISKMSKEESRAILTFDKHFLNKKEFLPEEHPGIIFISIIPPIIDTVFFSIMRLLNDPKYYDKQGKLFVVTVFGHREK